MIFLALDRLVAWMVFTNVAFGFHVIVFCKFSVPGREIWRGLSPLEATLILYGINQIITPRIRP